MEPGACPWSRQPRFASRPRSTNRPFHLRFAERLSGSRSSRARVFAQGQMGPAGGYFEGGGGGGSYYPTAFPAYPAAAYHGTAAAPDQVSPLDSSSGSESGAPPWLTDSSFDWAAESGSGSAGTHGSADSPSALHYLSRAFCSKWPSHSR